MKLSRKSPIRVSLRIRTDIVRSFPFPPSPAASRPPYYNKIPREATLDGVPAPAPLPGAGPGDIVMSETIPEGMRIMA